MLIIESFIKVLEEDNVIENQISKNKLLYSEIENVSHFS